MENRAATILDIAAKIARAPEDLSEGDLQRWTLENLGKCRIGDFRAAITIHALAEMAAVELEQGVSNG